MDTDTPGGEQAYAGVKCAIRASLNFIESQLAAPGGGASVTADLRRLRGAFHMLEIEPGAALVAEMERLAPQGADGDGTACRDAASLLIRALHELRALIDPPDPRLPLLLGLEGLTRELQTHAAARTPAGGEEACGTHGAGGRVGQPAGERPGHAAPDLDEEAQLADETDSGAGREGGSVKEAGMAKDRIKLPLKTIVQTLPAWWDDLLNAELLETLQSAFADIAGRASAAGLSEVAELALTLQRLVAKINDEMLPMTLQMMYGVVEQGVLKLGVLLLEGERPRAIGEFGTVKLVGAFADLKQLAHEVGEFTGDGAGEDPYPPMPVPPGGDGAAGYAVPVQADGLERLEDLLIEANLLHSQLLPRVNLMKRQQRHIQAELAALRRGGQGASDNAAGTLSGMLNANGALAKLILECEECLRRYRRATHELQQAILAEGTPEFAYPSLPQRLGAAADSTR